VKGVAADGSPRTVELHFRVQGERYPTDAKLVAIAAGFASLLALLLWAIVLLRMQRRRRTV
jgi:hypothetical protein